MNYSTEIDRKWQKHWDEINIAKFDETRIDQKLYVLEMFSYPSGANLHVGHWYNYGLSDSWARMKKMQGYEVFQPMGFDAFGLPAENYAIDTGIHPKDSTESNITKMEEQLKSMGGLFNWDHELATCRPEYYRWNQYLFLQLFKQGLAYRKKAPVNWCPHCNTVLANEQVQADHTCERCGTIVTKKNLTQWFFKITDYAEELLEKLPDLDWPETTKKNQANWIGRSEGAEITFQAIQNDHDLIDENGEQLKLKTFTTRVDTLYGVVALVVAPESELCELLTTPEQAAEVKAYQAKTLLMSDIDRTSTVLEKTGVFTGSYAINPINNHKIPIWTSDYVIAGYGTGCVMVVPGHDERDFEFCTKFDLPIIPVIADPEDPENTELPYVKYGILVNSGDHTGKTSEEAMQEIVAELAMDNLAEEQINYRLRDWLVSRQRYWGTPIPIVYCDQCGVVPVPESDLPVELPYDVDFTPDGESPLSKHAGFMNTTCPNCGGPAKRDPDTLDTFVCSSWYQFRFVDNKNDQTMFDKTKVNKMCPVDHYIGGAEHTTMHLLYSRFITKALRDMGYLDFDEPFQALTHQGTILGADGRKMSKSIGNTISPDAYINKYGSDTLRLFLAFAFSYVDGGPWNDDTLIAITKYMGRIERFVAELIEQIEQKDQSLLGTWAADVNFDPWHSTDLTKAEKELNRVKNYTIKEVTRDADKFQFNTSIARLMELLNALQDYVKEENVKLDLVYQTVSDYLRLLAPFAPHFSEELWESLGHQNTSIFYEKWPEHDEKALITDTVEIAVQFNGQLKGRINIANDAKQPEVEEQLKAMPEFITWLGDKTVRKIIYVPGKIINVVAN
ncbi:MAG TPA: leucine--tRNA ligase [Clostridiaceae bacterium]|nr:leucine--tRNA ligase [Clostridiaceae bacterium]